MNNEIWTYWLPVNIEKSDYCYYIVSLCQDGWDLNIILEHVQNKKHKLHISFNRAYCFRSTYELFTCMMMDKAYNKQGKAFFSGRQFYKVTNSQYIAWVQEQSGNVSDSLGVLEHYVISTDDQMVDILSYKEPSAKFIE